TVKEVAKGCTQDVVLNQLKLLRLRNTSKAFFGTVSFNEKESTTIDICWSYYNEKAHLVADLETGRFRIHFTEDGKHKLMSF
ncbi:glycosidase, partial [Flavobacteriaceae bacterium]|nr:glycosidase [Flavobacteriaceae bacterium]